MAPALPQLISTCAHGPCQPSTQSLNPYHMYRPMLPYPHMDPLSCHTVTVTHNDPSRLSPSTYCRRRRNNENLSRCSPPSPLPPPQEQREPLPLLTSLPPASCPQEQREPLPSGQQDHLPAHVRPCQGRVSRHARQRAEL